MFLTETDPRSLWLPSGNVGRRPMATSPDDGEMASFTTIDNDGSVFATVHAGKDNSMGSADLVFVEEKAGQNEGFGGLVGAAANGVRRMETCYATPPSVAEIAAAINEKHEAALHAARDGVKVRTKFHPSATMASAAISTSSEPHAMITASSATMCTAKRGGRKPYRCSAIAALRIPTIELKRSKSSNPMVYERLLVSDIDHGLLRNITLSTKEMEQRAGAGNYVLLIGNDDEQGVAEFVRRSAALHEAEIMSRCISALNLHTLVCSNVGEHHAKNLAKNQGLSLFIQQAAAAFMPCPNPKQLQLSHSLLLPNPNGPASCPTSPQPIRDGDETIADQPTITTTCIKPPFHNFSFLGSGESSTTPAELDLYEAHQQINPNPAHPILAQSALIYSHSTPIQHSPYITAHSNFETHLESMIEQPDNPSCGSDTPQNAHAASCTFTRAEPSISAAAFPSISESLGRAHGVVPVLGTEQRHLVGNNDARQDRSDAEDGGSAACMTAPAEMSFGVAANGVKPAVQQAATKMQPWQKKPKFPFLFGQATRSRKN